MHPKYPYNRKYLALGRLYAIIALLFFLSGIFVSTHNFGNDSLPEIFHFLKNESTRLWVGISLIVVGITSLILTLFLIPKMMNSDE